MQNNINLNAVVPEEYKGQRVDKVLSDLFPNYSREKIKTWLKTGECLIDQELWQPKEKVLGGEEVNIEATLEIAGNWLAQKINFEVVYQDEDLIIVNKPINLVVHPGAGNQDHTLVNGLLDRFSELQQLPRAGIVHRLDKDTSGLLVVARNITSHTSLTNQLQDRSVGRTYIALVYGDFITGGTIDEPIGRHPRNRLIMCVRKDGKPAITHYKILEKFAGATLLEIKLETGRTHQIRVHMEHIKHPIVGDQAYGKRFAIRAKQATKDLLKNFNRQALHASKLELIHPSTRELIAFSCDLPPDMSQLIQQLVG